MPSSQKALKESTEARAEKLKAKGKTVGFPALLKLEPDTGTTNIRNTKSAHWKRWLGIENRCVVPFTSFSEFNRDAGGDIWFAFGEERPLAVFAGIWASGTSVRKVRRVRRQMTSTASSRRSRTRRLAPIHPKAMPVILTTADEIDAWMTAPVEDALKLQRPLPDGSLQIVARGRKYDGAADPAGNPALL